MTARRHFSCCTVKSIDTHTLGQVRTPFDTAMLASLSLHNMYTICTFYSIHCTVYEYSVHRACSMLTATRAVTGRQYHIYISGIFSSTKPVCNDQRKRYYEDYWTAVDYSFLAFPQSTLMHDTPPKSTSGSSSSSLPCAFDSLLVYSIESIGGRKH
jgi:hypothetical protein